MVFGKTGISMVNLTEHKFFTESDKLALGWFWRNYLKSKMIWLFLILGMTAAQGYVYREFLKLTESGMRIVFERGTLQDLFEICAMVTGIFLFRGVVSYLTPRIATWIANDAVQRMRDDMVAKYLSLDLAHFDKAKSGDVILRLVQQADGLSSFVGQQTVKALRDAATILILSTYLIYKEPFLFAGVVFVVPFVLFGLRRVSKRIKEIQQSAEAVMGDFINGIEEMTNGMRTIRISGQEEMEKRRLATSTKGIRTLNIRLQAAQALSLPWMDFAAAVAFSMVIGGGGYMVLSPEYETDGASIIAFLIGLVLVFDPARRASSYFVALQAALILFRSIHTLMLETPEIVDTPNSVAELDGEGDIVFRDVSFSYETNHPLLHNLNLVFRGGRTTAIVGSTGSGKTTILSLLARLYEPQSGEITFDGRPLCEYKLETLRGIYSVVSQDIVIFNRSIFDNVKYVKPEASDQEVFDAAEAADILSLMEERGSAPVGPKGAQLSGGQKQRIGIARAFLQNKPVVILDEATSALDQKTEDRIRGAMEGLMKGRTSIVIAHRLSTVTQADLIYVLEHGKLIEQGNHSQLLAQKGLYASMYNAQQQGYQK
ncbi:ABC transporter ATP-binding protein [uncultured Shimia sp.]|uniref:ABC transporter ATP-binding protein n=1 Tax=uncultured Shimia sp. TaxID=573152 RepID=UPI0026237AF3|nr:ABC transporter ATP-binding protein [uncultured Shimia sp.]